MRFKPPRTDVEVKTDTLKLEIKVYKAEGNVEITQA